ncbi:hypothetical protein O181_074880, partial [Austropuccinia psidii MF-1]|nr:hypothetical protein [Austropuccinia psidii MF-1]
MGLPIINSRSLFSSLGSPSCFVPFSLVQVYTLSTCLPSLFVINDLVLSLSLLSRFAATLLSLHRLKTHVFIALI